MPNYALSWSILVVLTVAAAPVWAQDGPQFLVKTADERIARDVLDLFDSVEDLPALDEGGHWELALQEASKLGISMGQGLLGQVELVIKPAALLTTYQDRAAGGLGMIQGVTTMSLQAAGLPARDALQAARALVGWPKQIKQIRARIDGSLDQPKNGLTVQLWLTPVEDTWFDRLVKTVRPSRAPGLKLDDSNAAIAVRAVFDIESAKEVLQPVLDLGSRFGAQSEAETARRSALMTEAWGLFAGDFALTWNHEGGGMRSVVGLRQADRAQQLFSSPDWLAWIQSMQAAQGKGATAYEADVLQHRGANAYRMTTTFDQLETEAAAPLRALFPDGKLVMFGAVAGGCSVGATHESEVKALIDGALDNRLPREPLGNMQLLAGSMRLAHVLDLVTDGKLAVEEIPQKLVFELGNTGAALFLRISME